MLGPCVAVWAPLSRSLLGAGPGPAAAAEVPAGAASGSSAGSADCCPLPAAGLDFEAILLQPSDPPDKTQVPMVVMPHGRRMAEEPLPSHIPPSCLSHPLLPVCRGAPFILHRCLDAVPSHALQDGLCSAAR